MKKLLPIVLTMTMLFNVALIFNISFADDFIYTETYETATVGALPAGYTAASITGGDPSNVFAVTDTIPNSEGGANKSLKHYIVNKGKQTARIFCDIGHLYSTDRVVFNAKVYTKGDAYSKALYLYNTQVMDTGNSKIVLGIAFTNSAGNAGVKLQVINAEGGLKEYPISDIITKDTWTDIKIAINFSNENAQVTIGNNNTHLIPVKLNATTPFAIGGFSTHSYLNTTASNTIPTYIYLDDVSINGLDSTQEISINQPIPKQTVNINSKSSIDISNLFSDVNNAKLTITSDKGTITDGILEYTPTSFGNETITLTAINGNGSLFTYPINIDVVFGAQNLFVGETLSIDLSSLFIGSDLTYSAIYGDIAETIYTYSTLTAGTYNETITATDSNNETKTIDFSIIVTEPYRIDELITFEGETLNQTPSGFTVEGADGRTFAVIDPIDSNNTVLNTAPAGRNATIYANYAFEESIHGNILFDFDFMTDKPLQNAPGEVRFYSEDAVDINDYLFAVGIGKDTGSALRLTVRKDGVDTVYPTTTELSASTWKHIIILINSFERTLTLYVDGEIAAITSSQLRDFPLEVGSRAFNLKKFSVVNQNSGNSQKNLYLDNFRIDNAAIPKIILSMNKVKPQTVLVNQELTIDLSNEFFHLKGETITLSSDKGTINNNILTYTPTNKGEDKIIITASDAASNYTTIEIQLNVLKLHTVSISKSGSGQVSGLGTHQIFDGDTVTVVVFPDEGYLIEYIKYNGEEVVSDQLNGFVYTTPAIENAATIEVSFTTYEEGLPNALSSDTAFYSPESLETFIDDKGNEVTAPFGIAFASVKSNYADYARIEYGMLLSKTELIDTEFNVNNPACIKMKATVEPNSLGQYGIRFYGKEIQSGFTYFVRPYAIFKNADTSRTLYGNIESKTIGVSEESTSTVKTPIKVLVIGNSFSENAVKYLPEIAAAGNVELTLGRLYQAGCTLETYASNLQNDSVTYEYFKTGEANTTASIKTALESEEWDYITFQQGSHISADYNTYQPYLQELSDYVSELEPNAEQIIHQTWAYHPSAKRMTDPSDPYYQNMTADEMFIHVKDAYAKAATSLGARTIPSGEAFRNAVLFNSNLNLYITDGYHANSYGSFVAGAVWYEVLTGKSILENLYRPADISESDWEVLKMIAHVTASSYNK